jgi:hypothetical protein
MSKCLSSIQYCLKYSVKNVLILILRQCLCMLVSKKNFFFHKFPVELKCQMQKKFFSSWTENVLSSIYLVCDLSKKIYAVWLISTWYFFVLIWIIFSSLIIYKKTLFLEYHFICIKTRMIMIWWLFITYETFSCKIVTIKKMSWLFWSLGLSFRWNYWCIDI